MPEIGIKIAKQKSKGGPRDGNFNDRETPKGAATRAFSTNPATGKGSTEGVITKGE